MNQTAFASIIIPVYNDSERLKKCLTLLENQSYPQHLYEVIVVDNNSDEDLKPIVEQFPQAKYAFEANPGSYSARNRGIAIAKGEILGFTDSDCSPTLTWIEKGVAQILAHPDCGFVAGRITFSFKNPENPTPAEIYDSLHFLQQEKYVRDAHFGATANLFTRPKVFEAVGLFNSQLKSGGDSEWGERVYAAGYQQIYAADVGIFHPTRSDFKELNIKLCRVYEGDFYKHKKYQTPVLEFLTEILADLKPPVGYFLRMLKNGEVKEFYKRILVAMIHTRLRFSRAFVRLRLYWKNRLFAKPSV